MSIRSKPVLAIALIVTISICLGAVSALVLLLPPLLPGLLGSGNSLASWPGRIAATTANDLVVQAIESSPGLTAQMLGDLDALPPGTSFTVTATQSEIETAISAALAEGGYGDTINDVQVQFDGNHIVVSGTMQVPPFDMAVPGTLTLDTALDSEGNLAVSPASLEMGGISAPPDTLAVLEGAIAEAMGSASHVSLTNLVLEGDTITITGSTR